MSVSTTENYTSATLTTTNQVVPFPFLFVQSSDLGVVSNQRSELSLDTDYTVSGAGDPSGGDVTMIGGTIGETITITRNTAITQGMDLLSNGDLPAEQLEAAHDKGTIIDQDIAMRVKTLEDGTTAGFEEPPADGAPYSRTNTAGTGEWTAAMLDAAEDSKKYGRQDGEWVEVIEGAGGTVSTDVSIEGSGTSADPLSRVNNAFGLIDNSGSITEEMPAVEEWGVAPIHGPNNPVWNGKYNAFPSAIVLDATHPCSVALGANQVMVAAWSNGDNHWLKNEAVYGALSIDAGENDFMGKFWSNTMEMLPRHPDYIRNGGHAITMRTGSDDVIFMYPKIITDITGKVPPYTDYPNIYFRIKSDNWGNWAHGYLSAEDYIDLSAHFECVFWGGGGDQVINCPDGSMVMAVYGIQAGGAYPNDWIHRVFHLPPGEDFKTGWVKVNGISDSTYSLGTVPNETTFLVDDVTGNIEFYARREYDTPLKMVSTDNGATWSGLHEIPNPPNAAPARRDQIVDPATGMGYLIYRDSRLDRDGVKLAWSPDRFETIYDAGYILSTRQWSEMYGQFALADSNRLVLVFATNNNSTGAHPPHEAPCQINRVFINRGDLGAGGAAASSLISDETLTGDGTASVPASARRQGELDRASFKEISPTNGFTATRPHAVNLGGGVLLCAYSKMYGGAGRFGIDLAYSTDNGESWTNTSPLSDDEVYAPKIVVASGGTVRIYFSRWVDGLTAANVYYLENDGLGDWTVWGSEQTDAAATAAIAGMWANVESELLFFGQALTTSSFDWFIPIRVRKENGSSAYKSGYLRSLDEGTTWSIIYPGGDTETISSNALRWGGIQELSDGNLVTFAWTGGSGSGENKTCTRYDCGDGTGDNWLTPVSLESPENAYQWGAVDYWVDTASGVTRVCSVELDGPYAVPRFYKSYDNGLTLSPDDYVIDTSWLMGTTTFVDVDYEKTLFISDIKLISGGIPGTLKSFAINRDKPIPAGIYGSIYAIDNATAVAMATQNTWYQVTVFDGDGPSSGMEADTATDTSLVIHQTGDYLVTLAASMSGTANETYQLKAFLNSGATGIDNIILERKLSSGGDVGSMATSGIASMSAGDTLEVWARSTTSASTSVVCSQIQLNAVKL